MFFGSYERENAEARGIYTAVLNESSSTITDPERAAEISNPGFLVLSKDFQNLYAVCGEKMDSLAAFQVENVKNPSQPVQFKELNQLNGLGKSVCHLALDPSWKNILTAHYSSADFALFSLNEDHSLKAETQRQALEGKGPNEKRQQEPHPHSVKFGAGDRFYVPDLGTDRIMIYQLDSAKSSFVPNDPPYATVEPGSGPRHLCFLPDKKTVYVANELNSTVTAFHVHKDGGLESFQTLSTLPEGWKSETENTTAEVACTPDGRFLYISNRGHDSLACYKISMDGTLILREIVPVHGKNPRHFAVSPSGQTLIAANQDSRNITIFRIHPDSGKLTFVGEKQLPVAPVCVLFGPVSENDAEVLLQSLKTLKPQENSANWESKIVYPWTAMQKKITSMKPEGFPQELILARLSAETLDQLSAFIKMGFAMEKLSQEGENRDFVREITTQAVIQHATLITERFAAVNPKDLPLVKPFAREILTSIENVMEWNTQEPSLNICRGWMIHYSRYENPNKEEDAETGTFVSDPEAQKFMDVGIELALKAEGGFKNPELLSNTLMARAIEKAEKEPEEAIRNMELAASLNPELKERVDDSKLLLYVHAKQYEKALQFLDARITELETGKPEEKPETTESEETKEPEVSSRSQMTEEVRKISSLKFKCFRVEILLEMEKWEETLQATEEILKELEGLAKLKDSELKEKIRFWRLQAFLKLERLEDCVNLLTQMIEEDSIDSELYFMRAQMFLELNKMDEALQDLNEALRLGGYSSEVWEVKLSTLIQMNRLDDALKMLQERINQKPENVVNLMLQCSLIYIEQEKYAQALEWGLKAEKELPPEAEKTSEKPQSEESKEEEENSISGEDIQKLNVWQFLANWYLMAGEHSKALDYYYKCDALGVGDALTLNNIAWILSTSPEDALRDGKKAVEYAQKAVEMLPSPGNMSTLAAAYAECGDFEKALETIQKAFEAAKEEPEIMDSLNREKANYEAKKPTRERTETYKQSKSEDASK